MRDPARIRELAATVGGFAVRDKALLRAQAQIDAALAAGEPDPATVQVYLTEVRRYFTAFAREAAGQLAHVDRALERLYQQQYNLTAERGVAARRVEAIQGVLATLAEAAAQ